jgi:Concanavalin A-like lectin/glucanases superfamily
MLLSARSRAAAGTLVLLGGALALLLAAPWHGPIVLALSPTHGIDAGDLPGLALLAVALAAAHRLTRGSAASGMRRWAAAASAVVLGGLLLAGLASEPDPTPLSPTGGGTFDAVTERADVARAEPARQWSHLALTYEGATLRLYIDGDEVSSRSQNGSILKTASPLWIGGNHPYGEYFRGLIDEVEIYNRALSPGQLRAAMATPIGATTGPAARGLVGGWAFDRGSGRSAQDGSGEGNRGRLDGPTWTARGRFGGALRFDGVSEIVRVPASPSLDLTDAMTLSAWIRPAQVQAGWRTVVSRQTDAYFLMAGGGDLASAASDDVRISLIALAALCLCLALVVAHARWLEATHRWWPPVALFLAGSVIDVWLSSPGTVIGPCLVAVYYAATARRRAVAVGMSAVAALLVAVTALSLAGDAGADLARDEGGVARSAALGLVLVVAGLLAARRGSREAG